MHCASIRALQARAKKIGTISVIFLYRVLEVKYSVLVSQIRLRQDLPKAKSSVHKSAMFEQRLRLRVLGIKKNIKFEGLS